MKPDSVNAGGPVFHRHRLVSLWDLMRSFDLTRFLTTASSLVDLSRSFTRIKAVVTATDAARSRDGILRLQSMCVDAKLAATKAAVDRLLHEMDGGHLTAKRLGLALDDIRLRMIDELTGRLVLELSLKEAEHYSEPRKGWDAVIERFPSATSEIEEARKCFALGRYTACVFHMMRTLEPALAEISGALGIVKHSPTWNAYLEAIPKAIAAKFPEKTKEHAAKREYYNALEAQLRAIKTAWRNPTMHDVAKVYTEEIAEELMTHVKSFMREAAKEHAEPLEEQI